MGREAPDQVRAQGDAAEARGVVEEERDPRPVGQRREVPVQDLVRHLRPEVARRQDEPEVGSEVRRGREEALRLALPVVRGSGQDHLPGPLVPHDIVEDAPPLVLRQAPVLPVGPQRQVAEDPALRVAGEVEPQGAVVDILVRGEGRADRREDAGELRLDLHGEHQVASRVARPRPSAGTSGVGPQLPGDRCGNGARPFAEVRKAIADAEVRSGDADRADRPAVGSDDRGPDARPERLVLAVVGGVAAELRTLDLLPERGQIPNRPVGPRREVHPRVRSLALLVRQRGEDGLSQRSRVERHRLADGRDELDAVVGFELVDVDDPEVIHDAQVDGLPELVAQRGQVRTGDAPKVEANGGPVGQPQDPAGESVATRRLVLGHVPGLDEGPQEARHGRLVEVHLLAERRGPEPVLVGARQGLQDVETSAQGARHRRFTQ